MQYPSEKGRKNKLIFLGLGLWFFGLFIARLIPLFRRGDFLGLVFLIPLALLLWIWFRTHYEIKNGYLHYQSGPFFGKIDILKINKLEVGKTLRVGMRPALAPGGIIVHSTSDNDIYISPTDQSRFIEEMLSINSNIQVLHHSA